jgi:hypothetical protein
MELFIYNPNMVLLGVIDRITSLIWTRRYWKCGEFKLLVPLTEEHNRLLEAKNIVMKRGDNEAAEIRYIRKAKDAQGAEILEIQGKFLLVWMEKRVLLPQIITTDNTQNIIYQIINQTSAGLPIAASTEDEDTQSGTIVYTSEYGINSQLAIENAAMAAKLGIRVLTDREAMQHTLSVYKGAERTTDNPNGNPPCVFSPDFDNIIEQEFIRSIEQTKNVALVAGEEKEGEPRKIATVGDAVGAERNEVFINAGDIKQDYEDEDGNAIHIPDSQYLSQLEQRGFSELAGYSEVIGFSSKINTDSSYKYRLDYDVGDRVTCLNRRWGVKIDVRVTEITETYETGKMIIEATFGESLPTLIQTIRQIKK